MQILSGKRVFDGVAIGKIKIYQKANRNIVRLKVDDAENEMKRLYHAKEQVMRELRHLYEIALKELGPSEAAIFEAHQMILEDNEFLESVEAVICSQLVNAEYAIEVTGTFFSKRFAAVDNPFIRTRSADVMDITDRLLDVLAGKSKFNFKLSESVILMAESLTPSEVLQLDRDKILAFVMTDGSRNSHAAVLAKTMGVPALVGISITQKTFFEGKEAIVDGDNGLLYVEPDEATLCSMNERRLAESAQGTSYGNEKAGKDVPMGGCKIGLYANIGGLRDLELASKKGAAGVGLFRTELIYLERDCFPTEEEQFQIYRTVVESMAGKPVYIRTIDLGSDKKCDYMHFDPEDNPALGLRGIRVCLHHPELFRIQLRALLRAAVYGNLSILYPMIISVEEVRKIKALVAQTKAELAHEGIKYGEPRQGIMIETPAAVMISADLAKEVDFFSIGTNDLIQYTLATDRQNPFLDTYYDAHHPAVLKMIEMVVKNAHEEGIKVSICGEMAADMTLTKAFLTMGVDALSVASGYLLSLRKHINDIMVN